MTIDQLNILATSIATQYGISTETARRIIRLAAMEWAMDRGVDGEVVAEYAARFA